MWRQVKNDQQENLQKFCGITDTLEGGRNDSLADMATIAPSLSTSRELSPLRSTLEEDAEDEDAFPWQDTGTRSPAPTAVNSGRPLLPRMSSAPTGLPKEVQRRQLPSGLQSPAHQTRSPETQLPLQEDEGGVLDSAAPRVTRFQTAPPAKQALSRTPGSPAPLSRALAGGGPQPASRLASNPAVPQRTAGLAGTARAAPPPPLQRVASSREAVGSRLVLQQQQQQDLSPTSPAAGRRRRRSA